MDILHTIQDKMQLLPKDAHALGVKAVITHIETAEKYLTRGRKEGDENLYTDVIYRTNHAFEGILKEAYSILAEKDSSKHTPNDIEQYLTDNNIFKPRLMDLFKNYRTEWRNPSTHDHKLFFSEQEAFLAIVSVSAFVNILLDQIIEKINFAAEKEKTANQITYIRNTIVNYDGLPLLQKLRELFLAFSHDLIRSNRANKNLRPYEVLGLLSGFFTAIDPTLKVEPEIEIGSRLELMADMIFSYEDEKVIIEIKHSVPITVNLSRAQDQLSIYLLKSGIREGILYFIPTSSSDKMESDELLVESEKETLNIVRIFPKQIK